MDRATPAEMTPMVQMLIETSLNLANDLSVMTGGLLEA